MAKKPVIIVMGVDHGGIGGTSPPEFGVEGLSPPRFCHVAKF